MAEAADRLGRRHKSDDRPDPRGTPHGFPRAGSDSAGSHPRARPASIHHNRHRNPCVGPADTHSALTNTATEPAPEPGPVDRRAPGERIGHVTGSCAVVHCGSDGSRHPCAQAQTIAGAEVAVDRADLAAAGVEKTRLLALGRRRSPKIPVQVVVVPVSHHRRRDPPQPPRDRLAVLPGGHAEHGGQGIRVSSGHHAADMSVPGGLRNTGGPWFWQKRGLLPDADAAREPPPQVADSLLVCQR